MEQTKGQKNADKLRKTYGNDYFHKIGSAGGNAPHTQPRGLAAVSKARRAEISKLGAAKRWANKPKKGK